MINPGSFIIIIFLFTDFWVDLAINVMQYESGKFNNPSGPYHYNIYCYGRFQENCLKLGATRLEYRDFHIDIDLFVPSHRLMGTYTLKAEGGKRLQYSGPLLMPWRFIAIQGG